MKSQSNDFKVKSLGQNHSEINLRASIHQNIGSLASKSHSNLQTVNQPNLREKFGPNFSNLTSTKFWKRKLFHKKSNTEFIGTLNPQKYLQGDLEVINQDVGEEGFEIEEDVQ